MLLATLLPEGVSTTCIVVTQFKGHLTIAPVQRVGFFHVKCISMTTCHDHSHLLKFLSKADPKRKEKKEKKKKKTNKEQHFF
jgi:hypothetical protein